MLLRYQRAILIGFTLLIYSLQGYTNVLAVDQVISEQEGKTVIVPCPVNKDKCGELHSLNWFKGDNRIAAMLLDDSNVTSVAEEFEDRVSVEQNPFRLIIRNLQISDEDIYLCDTTYFIPIETCDNFNGHRVELNVLVPPSEVVILDEKGDRIVNDSIVGPMQERQTIKATCIVKNTRPQPQVGWWRGNKRLTTHSPSYDENDGLFTATLELSLQLSRDDLGHSIECRAESAAIQTTIKNQFSVDLQVRPTTVTINGVEHHTVQGSKVVLTCDVHGARPPVNLTWFNASQPMDPAENDLMEIRTRAFEKDDGTYHTQSDLIFNASRFENDVKFVCQAENIVLQINREAPMQSLLTLEVLYPPVVKVSPPEITVNTSDTVLLNCEYVANPASLDHVVWYRNGDVVNVNDTQRYEGGNSENVALVIRATDKRDIGNYTCQLSNSIGKGVSEQQIDLDVQFVPVVEVLMIPEGPVRESDESNVTLFCNILEANPAVLTKVRWYANATLLKELPDCEETREDLCHIDPSKLLLESIGRGFFYNYSCEGYNAAGWGPRSEDKELLVHYEPGPATLTHFPLIAVKKKSVTFSCAVDDPGYPESNRYRWLRGGRGPLQDIVTKDWTVEPVGLDSRTNYSCYAFNEGGKGVMATVNLEVHAPPFFIKNLSPYTGVLHTSRNANLTCRIECVPRCEISWLKDGVPIEKNDTRYFVKDKYMDASPATGDFESMLSVLHFNMSNWPNNKFDIEGDNANYTCVSTGNTVGPGIKSATYFSIQYAPDNTTVSEEIVYVQEETIPGRVICKSRANPEPTYEWRFNNKTVIRGNALIINTPMMRNDTGRYTCVAFNKHGISTAEIFIDVQFKPRCEIERQEIEDKDTLICTAYGNPEEADFSWSIKAENETVEWLGNGDHKTFKDKSYYELKEDYAIARTYRCVANNTAGIGTFCEIEVAEQLGWWQRWDKTTLIILVASILLLLLAVIIICCIIICICRRRRRQDKYRTDVSMSATHSTTSTTNTGTTATTATAITTTTTEITTLASTTSTVKAQTVVTITTPPTPPTKTHLVTTPPLSIRCTQVPKSPPRWPLRPGVMVHVSSDTKENLAVNRMTLKPSAILPANLTASALNDSTLSSSTLNNSAANHTQTTLLNLTQQSTTLGRTNHQGRLPENAQQDLVCMVAANENETNKNKQKQQLEPPQLSLCQTLPRREKQATALTEKNLQTSTDTPTEQLNSIEMAVTNNSGVANIEASGTETTNTSKRQLSNLKRVELFFTNIFFKRSSKSDGCRDSQRSHVGLLGGKFWKRSEAATTHSSKSPFSAEHRLKGIRSSGSGPTTISAQAHQQIPPQNTTQTLQAQQQQQQTQQHQLPASTTSMWPSLNINLPAHIAQSEQRPASGTMPGDRSITTLIQSIPSTIVSSRELRRNPSQSPQRKSILKAPTPPPRPPPITRTIKRSASQINSQNIERIQIQEKSSSMADPLTEPGEYENLPFHGLQTAPNKLNKRKPLQRNPFLAANPAAAAATTCHKKLYRRQTISDPYAHIKHINECRRQSNNIKIDSSSCSGNNNTTHNNCPKSPNAFKATPANGTPAAAAAAAAATRSPYKSQQQYQQHQQQQTDLQQCNKTQQPSSSLSHYSTPTSCPQHAAHHQQMLMPTNVANNCKINIDDNGRPYNELVIHVVNNESNVAATNNNYYQDQDKGDQSFNTPHQNLHCDVANNETKRQRHANQVVKRGHNRSMSHTTTLVCPTLEDATNTKPATATFGYMERPVKLPLRKYHSFHFQPTQTVAGQQSSKLQQLQKNYLQSNLEMPPTAPDISSSQPYAAQGPLVFRPYQIDESLTFKPIHASEESEESLDYVKEYIGTVEKFLKDEEKYMDSGDFSNLTQRLKKQQHFLNSDANCSRFAKARETTSCVNQANVIQTDSEPNSLYEDLSFPTKSETLAKSDFNFQLFKKSADMQKPMSAEDLKEKSTSSAHSTRALNLLKAVIENDSFQSEEELEMYPHSLRPQRDPLVASSPKISPLKLRANDSDKIFIENKNLTNHSQISAAKDLNRSPLKLTKNFSLHNDSEIVKYNKILVQQEQSKDSINSPNERHKKMRDESLCSQEKSFGNGAQATAPKILDPQQIVYEKGDTISVSFLARKHSKSPTCPKHNIEHLNSPKCATAGTTTRPLTFASEDSSHSVLSEQDLEKLFKPYEQKQVQHAPVSTSAVSTAVNPAASLEALEFLTKSNPELWSSNQAGSRHNLHQLELFHTLQQQNKSDQLTLSHQPDEEEDLGYSFCEDDSEDDDEDRGDILNKQEPPTSPNVTLLMAPNSQLSSQVKYILTQNHGEVHI